MKQVIVNMVWGNNLQTGYRVPIFGGLPEEGVDVDKTFVVPENGIFRNLVIKDDIDGAEWTLYTVATNNTKTPTDIVATSVNQLAVSLQEATVAAGDLVVLERSAGGVRTEIGTSSVSMSIEFETTGSTSVSIYGNGAARSANTGAGGAFGGHGVGGGGATPGAAVGNYVTLTPIAGNVTKLVMAAYFDWFNPFPNPPYTPSPADTWFEGVLVTYDPVTEASTVHDGSGGTTDTRTRVTYAANGWNIVTSTFSVAVAVGTLADIYVTTNNGAAVFLPATMHSVSFTADVPGRFILAGSNQTHDLHATGEYGAIPGWWESNERGVQGAYNWSGVSSFRIGGLAFYNGGWGGGTTELTLMKNGSVPANAPTVTLEDGASCYEVDADTSHLVRIDYGDYFSTRATPPSDYVTQMHWSFFGQVVGAALGEPIQILSTHKKWAIQRFDMKIRREERS